MNYEKKKAIEESEAKTLQKLEEKAREIRKTVVSLFGKRGGGHFGGSLSLVDIITTLYYRIMRTKPSEPHWSDRDRFILSKGHACPALYATLADKGYFTREVLDTFEEIDSPLTMHPDMHTAVGVDMSTGSMGHGLSIGVGMSLAGKIDKKVYRVFVLMGDGEIQEGSVWEAAMAGSHYKLDNLVVIVDRNRLSVDGFVEEIMSIEPIIEKWKSFGWAVKQIDGHKMKEIIEALGKIPLERGKPTAIIAQTIKGKGVPFMENKPEWHRKDITPEELREALKALE